MKDKFTKILKLNDFELSDELINIFYDRINYTKNILNNLINLQTNKDLWIYLIFWFDRKTITDILSISQMTFYKLDNYFMKNGSKKGISNKLLNKIEKLRLIIYWFINEVENHEEK